MSIIGIGESVNPLLTIIPMVLMGLSGYTVGAIISKVRSVPPRFFRDLIYGNIVVNFLFLSGFIIFGVLTSAANQYFTVFTFILIGLSILGVYFLLKLAVAIVKSGRTDGEPANIKLRIKSIFFGNDNQATIFVLFGIALFVTLLVYQATIIYYHPIYNEYDSMYLFLPISKSILLGNGLNHDFYLGSDVNMRFPPFIQALNAWLIHSFEYSSVRMFPFYYVFFAAILVYSLTRNILIKTSGSNHESSFFGLIASSAFLITPALLVVSSRFSLQQDLGFIFILTASFYFLSEIVRHDKPAKTTLLLLTASLALMALTREIGMVIAIAIFFLVPAIKYTEGNLKLRALFTVLCFLPLHFYYVVLYAPVEINSGVLLIISNIAVFFIVSQLKNQNKFYSLIIPVSKFRYIIPLVIPVIYILSNIIIYNGVYPGIVSSDRYDEIVDTQVAILSTQNNEQQAIFDIIKGIPRIDILFTSVALGSVIIFFKLVGFYRLIRHLKNNYEYSLVIILILFLLVTWSFLLESGFEISDVRHVLYFAPLLSVILVIGMKLGKDSSYFWQIYCYLVIVVITFYFITYNLQFLTHNGNFSGFSIDPFKNSIMSPIDLGIGIILVVPLIIAQLKLFKTTTGIKKKIRNQGLIRTIIIISLTGLLVAEIYIMYSNRVNISPLQEIDEISPPGWETNVTEVIDYLKTAEKGNVLAVRAPALPFFTNRTSFDVFNQQAFTYNISDLLSSRNSTLFKNKLSEMDIKYIVVPSKGSKLYYVMENIVKTYPLLQVINADPQFEKVIFRNFNLYKYIPEPARRMDLIDEQHVWKPFAQAEINQNADNLTIRVDTDKKDLVFNRGFLQTELNLTKPLLLSLRYKIETNVGNATYAVEIRDTDSGRILFNSLLDNLSGNATDKTFILPTNIGLGKPVEFRVYVTTQGIGYHAIVINKFDILQR